MTNRRGPIRPNEDDWVELAERWWEWATDAPVRSSWLYARIGAFLDGWQFPDRDTYEGKLVRFGQELTKRHGIKVGRFRLRYKLVHKKPMRWLEPVDPDGVAGLPIGLTWLDSLTQEDVEALIRAYREDRAQMGTDDRSDGV